MARFTESWERNARRAETRAARADDRADLARRRADRARELVGDAQTPDEHERAVRHLMAHEFAADAQHHAADALRRYAAEDRGA